MINAMKTSVFSYTRTPYLIENLSRLEHFRKEIQALIIPRHRELKLRWEALSLRTFYAFSLYDLSLQKQKLINRLSSTPPFSAHAKSDAYTRYRDALQMIQHSWYATGRQLNYDDFKELYNSIWSGVFPPKRDDFLNAALFLEERETSPVIAALFMFLFMYKHGDQLNAMLPFSHLTLYMLLSRAGIDFRGLVVFEDYLHSERAYFKTQLLRSIELQNATAWLEYAAFGFSQVAENFFNSFSLDRGIDTKKDTFFMLSERQKKILMLLEEPQSSISNKKVQQICRVSQVTASRELAKLVELGLIYPQGSGRSTVYILARA